MKVECEQCDWNDDLEGMLGDIPRESISILLIKLHKRDQGHNGFRVIL